MAPNWTGNAPPRPPQLQLKLTHSGVRTQCPVPVSNETTCVQLIQEFYRLDLLKPPERELKMRELLFEGPLRLKEGSAKVPVNKRLARNAITGAPASAIKLHVQPIDVEGFLFSDMFLLARPVRHAPGAVRARLRVHKAPVGINNLVVSELRDSRMSLSYSPSHPVAPRPVRPTAQLIKCTHLINSPRHSTESFLLLVLSEVGRCPVVAYHLSSESTRLWLEKIRAAQVRVSVRESR